MAPRKKLLRASPKPTGRLVKKAKATGKPKGSSPSMVLGSASKAGMQSKQGRNFLLPMKPKSKRPKILPGSPPRGKPEIDRGKPMPRPRPRPPKEKFPDILKKLGPYKLNMTRDEMQKRLRQMINDRKKKKK
jgi:hypothetical protein